MLRAVVILVGLGLGGLSIGCSSKKVAKDDDKTAALPKPRSATPSAASSGPSPIASKPAPPSTEVSANPSSAPDAAVVAGAPRAGWPLPAVDCIMNGTQKPCKTASGEPGVSCNGATCINPCPVGFGPDDAAMQCNRICKSDADCRGTPCTPSGVCAAPKISCEGGTICTLPNGNMGIECNGKCENPCKPTQALYGGTHCAKPCTKAEECPGGECSEGFCLPLCPAEGCPYPWE